jgi:hypothetical protein
MKIRRSGRTCIAKARNARRLPATPPASRLEVARVPKSEDLDRVATMAPAPSAIAISAASPSETTLTIIQRASISGRIPTVAP